MKLTVLIPIVLGLAGSIASAQSFYREDPLFSTAPNPSLSSQTIDRFGPVGIGIELINPTFTMRIKNVEEGSPALTAGLKAGQIITTINGETLKDIDPRIQLGNLITAAEAKDGKLVMEVTDKPGAATSKVNLQIPVLGSYSATWPLNCPKSDKIVRNFADYLKTEGTGKGFADIGMLFLLSTGDDSDLEYVRQWAQEQANKGASGYPWHIGYGGLALCEYYLRTGDATVLPAIQARADRAIEQETFGGWAGRGPLAAVTYGGGGGHLNAGGTLVVAYLMLAKECGAEIAEEPFNRILAHFYRFAGRGMNPYGNNLPENGYTDNGKNGKLAFAMAAAASLTTEGEESIYAKARDVNANFAFYSTSYMLHGHTGGGIGEIWRSASMGLLQEKRQNQYRDFMDQRRWHYEMSRRFNGSFGILGGARYDNEEWGTAYALTYTVPRKTLQLTGAPKSKFSKPYQLPKRPWGTAADDDFVNPEPPAFTDGTRLDLSGETLRDSAAIAINKLLGSENLDRETMDRYLHHRDYAARMTAARSIKRFGPDVLLDYLSDKDARVRRAALEGMIGSKTFEESLLNKQVFDRMIAMLQDPEESWFVKEIILRGVGKAPSDWVVPHTDLIISFFKHEEWWLQRGATYAINPIIGDDRSYERVIPALAELVRTSPLFPVTGGLRWSDLPDKVAAGSPDVQELARKELKEAFDRHQELDNSRKIDALDKANEMNIETIAKFLIDIPGGYDVLYESASKRYPQQSLPLRKLFLDADPAAFSPGLRKIVTQTIVDELIPEYVGRNYKRLLAEVSGDKENVVPTMLGDRPGAGLVGFYNRIGLHDYDWHDFGPKMSEITWDYHSFDPPEKLPWLAGGTRYRKVTFPAGMENWFAVDFDAAKAGWKIGRQPIGQENGNLRTEPKPWIDQESNRPLETRSPCSFPFCRCCDPMASLWEKEVLLARTQIEKLPAFKDGHHYRIAMGGMGHMNIGEGFRLYANGKLIMEVERGRMKREVGPICFYLDQTWRDELSKGPINLAVVTFLREHKVSGVRNGFFALWFEEMKLPPLGVDLLHKSAQVISMSCSAWQALQDPDNAELDPEEGKFRWDGNFTPNTPLLGTWKLVAEVASIEEFNPDNEKQTMPNPNSWPLGEITIKDQGATSDPAWLWTGNTLMNLNRYEALQMKLAEVGGKKFLFIEAGGFNAKGGPNWKSKQIVMTLEE